METIAYEGPDGELLLDPTLEVIRELLNSGPDYWQGGSGSAYVGRILLRDPGYSMLTDRPVLHVIAHEPYGVCLMYEIVGNRTGKPGISLLSYNQGPLGVARVQHYLGGEPAYFPRESFVAVSVCERVIGDFLRTQTPSRETGWRPRRSLADGYDYAEKSRDRHAL